MIVAMQLRDVRNQLLDDGITVYCPRLNSAIIDAVYLGETTDRLNSIYWVKLADSFRHVFLTRMSDIDRVIVTRL